MDQSINQPLVLHLFAELYEVLHCVLFLLDMKVIYLICLYSDKGSRLGFEIHQRLYLLVQQYLSNETRVNLIIAR